MAFVERSVVTFYDLTDYLIYVKMTSSLHPLRDPFRRRLPCSGPSGKGTVE